jgi:hypothetical protein
MAFGGASELRLSAGSIGRCRTSWCPNCEKLARAKAVVGKAFRQTRDVRLSREPEVI